MTSSSLPNRLRFRWPARGVIASFQPSEISLSCTWSSSLRTFWDFDLASTSSGDNLASVESNHGYNEHDWVRSKINFLVGPRKPLLTTVNLHGSGCHTSRQPLKNHPSGHLGGWATPWSAGRKYWALRPQKPLRLIRDGEVGGSEILYLTPTRYTVTTRMILH